MGKTFFYISEYIYKETGSWNQNEKHNFQSPSIWDDLNLVCPWTICFMQQIFIYKLNEVAKTKGACFGWRKDFTFQIYVLVCFRGF